MKSEWIDIALELAGEPANFYSGCRKILTGRSFTFKRIRNDLHMEDAGYTKSKMTMLTKNYLHEESKAVAIELWKKRLGQRKYGSVSFTCFAHFVKGGSIDAKRSKRASVFGPCLQSVVITYMERTHTAEATVFYRTTELLKKYPADLVFIRDVLLDGFDFSTVPLKAIHFNFAGITMHPMYWVTILPHVDDPIEEMEIIKEKDHFFWVWCVKWSARYLIQEHRRGIEKFGQAMRVHKDANERISPKHKKLLIQYLGDNHPGFRNEYIAPEEDEDEN